MLRPDHYLRIAACAALMGLPVQDCIDEAIEDWLTIVAPARLDSQNEKPDNLIAFR
jgi:hypothetical protein